MQGNNWNDVLDRARPEAAANGSDTVTSVASSGDNAALPASGEPYRAAAAPSNDSLTRLCCVMGSDGFQPGGKAYRFFQYVHLDSDTDFGFSKDGQVFTLRFAGMKPVAITVRGRNLLRICDSIHLHRMPWIRVADRDFRAADGVPGQQPIITEIRIEGIE